MTRRIASVVETPATRIERERLERSYVGRPATPAEIDTYQRYVVGLGAYPIEHQLGLVEQPPEPLDVIFLLAVFSFRRVVVPPVDKEDDQAALATAVGRIDQLDRSLELRRRPGFSVIVELDEGQRVVATSLDVLRPVHLGFDASGQGQNQHQKQYRWDPSSGSILAHLNSSCESTLSITNRGPPEFAAGELCPGSARISGGETLHN
jgi:hypothetical protein